MSTARIPPEGEDLEFIENTRTGTVHILPYDGSEPQEIPAGQWAKAIATLLTSPPPPMLCGTRLRHTWPGAPGQPISEFPDADLCRACIRALGDQAARAFEHPPPRSSHAPTAT
ncbi:MAG: hypothetical protein ACRDPY_22165 [Streptosporangiaceae bacterium]